MSYYYPRAVAQLRILPEDYHLSSDPYTQDTTTINVQCRDVSVERNDYRTADTFTMEVDYKSFPFDPRTIRACGVVIYMADVGRQVNDDGSINELIPGDATKVDPNISNAVFIGWVDEAEVVFDDNGRKVMFRGRDTTALLIDQKYTSQAHYPGGVPPYLTSNPMATISNLVQGPFYPNLPLDKAIKKLLVTFPATKKIQIYSSPGVTMPIIATYDPGFGSKMAGGMNTGGGKRESYWDIIQDLAGRAGLICYMGIGQSATQKGDIVPTIYLVTPKNQGLNIDPATGQQSSDTIDDIKIIYGYNVKNLNFKRKIGRLKNFNIQVISRNGKKVITAKIPEEATQDWCKKYGLSRCANTIPQMLPNGSIDSTAASINRIAPYITFPYPKTGSKQALVQIGQMLYEQYSLQQLEGSFETWEMLGFGSQTAKNSFTISPNGVATKVPAKEISKVYDMTQIRKGQTIKIEIDSDDLKAISRFSNPLDRTQYLINRGYSPKVADLFAKTMGKMSPRFQIKSYSMRMNEDSGFELKVNFYNLIDNTNRVLE